MADRDVRVMITFPDIFPHMAGNLPVNGADRVTHVGQLQGQNRHEKRFVVPQIFTAQFPELGPGDTGFPYKTGKIILHQFPAEPLVPGLNRGMSRKDAAGPNNFRSFVKGQPLLQHETGNSLQQKKCRVSLIDVIDSGFEAQLAQEFHATHPQQDFLFDACPLIRRVKPVRDSTVLNRVSRQIRIQQIQRDAPHLDLPYVRIKGAPGQIDGHLGFIPQIILNDLQGHVGQVVLGILGDLDSILIDNLMEITVFIVKPHSHQRNVQIACRLEMIAGKGPQTAGIDGNRFMQSVFRGKVGNGIGRLDFRCRKDPFVDVFLFHILVEKLENLPITSCIEGIVRRFLQLVRRDHLQHPDGVIHHFIPCLGIQRCKQIENPRIPGPPDVVCQLSQSRDFLRQMCNSGKIAEMGLGGYASRKSMPFLCSFLPAEKFS